MAIVVQKYTSTEEIGLEVKPEKKILAWTSQRVCHKSEAKYFANSRGFLFFETSPKIDSDINRDRVKNTVTGVP